MQFTTSFISLLAAVSTVAAFPWSSQAHTEAALAPSPVTSLDYGDGHWVAQWSTSVFHISLFGAADKVDMSQFAMGPIPINSLNCESYKCTANLDYGDGRRVAQWPTAVSHPDSFGREKFEAISPYPVTGLKCDGESYKCTANLGYGDGRWVAQWTTAVLHN
ncbi:hypothetical protein D9619_013436 [Psilocybe cf. subviscida]|uniref:Uncharacterized protein n=1 Tax=Psilocybe cf. subviscida TaxID=2480587 RepID=A0A8H5BSB8_9AGAR|nr:hypothetical protein D9619_013436 [Psilocybe cf. subviscida]